MPETVRAKFKCESITRRKHWDKEKGEIHDVKLTPVMGNTPENEEFYAATPSGSIELGTVNGEAAAMFELGEEYYVEFFKA